MNVLFLLIPVSLILLVIAVAVFFWAVRSGQFDDLDTPAYRILMDTDERRRHGHDTTGTDGVAGDGRTSGERDDEQR